MDGVIVTGPFSLLMTSGLPYLMAQHAISLALSMGVVGLVILVARVHSKGPKQPSPPARPRSIGTSPVAGRFVRLMILAGVFGVAAAGLGLRESRMAVSVHGWIDGLARAPRGTLPSAMEQPGITLKRTDLDRLGPALGFQSPDDEPKRTAKPAAAPEEIEL
ncbi:MAG: hypothetical protein ACFB6R_01260 [Alphaproteobacteria bacterium]